MIAPRQVLALEGKLKHRLGELNETLRPSAEGQRRELRRVEAALARIRGGLYGICCACEYELSMERLQADPATPFCMECEVEIEDKPRGRGA